MSRIRLAFIFVLLLSILLRFYCLGINPPSLDWDEASLGYNAYHLLNFGTDEYGNSWPLAIRSFGDYKPPMYVWLTIPAVAIFGLNEFAVRLPSAIFGVLTVVVTFFLVRRLFNRNLLAITAMFFLAISPWHIQFSRIAFEANVGLFFFVCGVWLFLEGVKKGIFLVLSAMVFGLCLYSYHSPRLVLPLLLAGFTWYYRQELWQKKKALFLVVFLVVLMIFPLVRLFFNGAGQARFSSVSVFSASGVLDRSIKQIEQDQEDNHPLGFLIHNRRIAYSFLALKGYLDHFNFNFLFLKGDGPGRHHALGMGMLYLWDFPFILFGLYWLLSQKGSFPLLWWFLVAPAASAISTGTTPHAVRALLYLPTFQIFSAFGLLELLKRVFRKKLLQRGALAVALGLLAFNIFYYLHQYYVHTPVEYAPDWQYGYKQMVEVVKAEENNFKQVIVTDYYDQPYIFFLFYGQKNSPKHINPGFDRLGFGKYIFRRINWAEDENLSETLLVGAPSEIPAETASIKKEILFPSGEVAFRIVGR